MRDFPSASDPKTEDCLPVFFNELMLMHSEHVAQCGDVAPMRRLMHVQDFAEHTRLLRRDRGGLACSIAKPIEFRIEISILSFTDLIQGEGPANNRSHRDLPVTFECGCLL